MAGNASSSKVLGYSKGPFFIDELDLISPLSAGSCRDEDKSKDVQIKHLERRNDDVQAAVSASELLGPVHVVQDADLGSHVAVPGSHEGNVSRSKEPRLPWSSLFKDNRRDGKGFKLTKMETSPQGPIFVDEDFVEERDWELCLIGCFGGSFPGLGPLKLVTKKWKGKFKMQMHDSGWIVFQFEVVEDILKVLSEGPYFVNGRPLMLKRMPKFFSFGHEEMHMVPIWIRLVNLPLILWKDCFLSKIASYLGNPISTDQVTACKGTYNYARVLVEVDVSKELPKEIDITLPDRIHKQLIHYERVPLLCSTCGRIGHTSKGHELFTKDEKARKGLSKFGAKRVLTGGLPSLLAVSQAAAEVDELPVLPGGEDTTVAPIIVDSAEAGEDLALPGGGEVALLPEPCDGLRQADLYLKAHSSENISAFLSNAYKGIGEDHNKLTQNEQIFSHEAVDEELRVQLQVNRDFDKDEKFIKVLTKKEKRRQAKHKKGNDFLNRDKGPSSLSLQ